MPSLRHCLEQPPRHRRWRHWVWTCAPSTKLGATSLHVVRVLSYHNRNTSLPIFSTKFMGETHHCTRRYHAISPGLLGNYQALQASSCCGSDISLGEVHVAYKVDGGSTLETCLSTIGQKPRQDINFVTEAMNWHCRYEAEARAGGFTGLLVVASDLTRVAL